MVGALIHTNCRLSRLNLSNNNIGDQALIHKKSRLISLHLSWNNIGDRSIEDLVRALVHRNCKVITFNLFLIITSKVTIWNNWLKHSLTRIASSVA